MEKIKKNPGRLISMKAPDVHDILNKKQCYFEKSRVKTTFSSKF
jgi:hypothetical protein